MKARYRYRIYPTLSQKISLAKLFGCVGMVWNDVLAYCVEQYHLSNKKPKNGELQKTFITQAKKTPERQWLKEVSNIPLQQSLNDLEQAYQNCRPSSRSRKGSVLTADCFSEMEIY